MNKIKYHFSYNENNSIIDIADVTPAYRKEHQFYCISCGKEIIAKLGHTKAHHFSHKAENQSCSSESYLHELTKHLLKRKFDTSNSFNIEFNREVYCKEKNTCPFFSSKVCYEKTLETFNLKDFFNTCNEEESIQKYRADLLLSNSSKDDRPPILLGVKVSHECTLEKIKSGLKIIEITIHSEQDIRKLVKNNITEGKTVKFYRFRRRSTKPIMLYKKTLSRFILFNNSLAYATQFEESPNCEDIHKKRNINSLLELNIDIDYFGNSTIYEYGLVKALSLGYKVKNCHLCKYMHAIYLRRHPLFCCMSKNYGTPQHPKQNQAERCKYYVPNKKLIKEVNKALKSTKISEV